MKPIYKTLLWLTAFSIAMGYLETTVVIYLRELYYPQGFSFPLVPMPAHLAAVEFWREVATVVMLAGIAILSAKNNWIRFAYFLLCFAVWDIFYYVFLKICLNWPASLFTWDILFLIPMPWLGPVLAPCLVALTMLALGLVLVYFHEKGCTVSINKKETFLFLLGCAIILLSFTWDYFVYVTAAGNNFWTLGSSQKIFADIMDYVPVYYNWWLFITGEGLLLTGIYYLQKRLMQARQNIPKENREWLHRFITNYPEKINS